MLDWLFSASIPVLLAVSSVTILSAGCLIARWLARRPAGALRSVIVCGVLAIALPAAFAGVRAAGWGLLPRDDSPSIDDSGKSIHVLASGMPEGTTLDFLDQKLAGDAYPSMADEKVDAANESRAVVTRSVERDPQTAAAAVALRAVIASIDWAAAGWTVAGLWFFASLVLTVRLIPAFVRGRHLARTSEHVTNEARLRSMQRAARRLGIVQVELRQTGAICSPVVWCWGSRPIVLVPATPLGDSTTDLVAECVDWESVFVHELAHWRRGDHWAALLGELLIAAFPWNPLAWMMRQRIAFLADCACDEEVMRLGTSPARYAESLMLFSCEHVSLALGVASAKSLLFRRICAILAPECGRRPDRGWSWLLSAAIASALAITFLQPSARRQALAESPEPLWPQNPPADERLPATAAKWDERIAALPEGDWRSAFAVGGELASLPADEGFDILSRVWPKMSIDTRQQMMKAFRFKGSNNLPDLHARLIDVMHLGMTGSQPKVQEWSINYLREIAFEDFSQDINAYHKWYAANHGRNPRDVMMENCRRYIGELRSGDPKALDKLSDNDFRNHVARSPDLQQAMIEAGAPDLVERWLKAPPTTEKGQRMLAALIA
ncbi:MAG: M56 family metallopeptidase, partial [Phycisphaerales bacterium]|nr:M56 family metallopeptidase [Phycisphaerales bacterium]